MINQMTQYVPTVKKIFSNASEVDSLSGVQADIHLDEFCPEWVYSYKTRRDAVETLIEAGYQPDFIERSDSSPYRLVACDGRYFSVTPTMFEYAVSLQQRDIKGFYFHKIGAKKGKVIANNHEMAYS
ncbi:hypothetical protein MNC86_22140 [Pantoea agglomerans]|uniref:hypothetical protein n=1 Tax=Enterobacter agglomerans TaxID=549 RepID=UPI001F4ECD4F|nr:hypothetical protein [Pantoea agglomerans]MCH9408678.1 hypothetical protein [Pantoea agglomerans]